MKINAIASSANALLKRVRGLHQRSLREKSGLFLIEGTKAVGEAVDKGVLLRDLVVSESYWKSAPAIANLKLAQVSLVEDKLFADLSTTTSPEGIIAVADIPNHSLEELFLKPDPLIVVADAIQDPGNLGTIVRTALAAGAAGIMLAKGTVDPYSPKVVRAAMGALFSLPVVWDIEFTEAVRKLKEKSVRVMACDPEANRRYFESDLKGAVAVVVGNEGQGLSREHLELVDEVISIPMNPLSESLNVAISAAIVLFAAVEQRMKGNCR
jgi:TrmH family RNA methyltransferase